MGNITSCCDSCCASYLFPSHGPPDSLSAQSMGAGPSPTNHCCLRTKEKPSQTSCSTLRVRAAPQVPLAHPHDPPPDRTTTNFFTGSPLSALTTLSFSDNVDLQRSAALAFAEITEKEVRPVGRDTLDPILFLLSSHDTEVQRAASAALGNLAVNSECDSTTSRPPAHFLTDFRSGQQASDCQAGWFGASYPPDA